MDKQGKYLTSFQRKLLIKSLENEGSSQYRHRIEIMLMADEGRSQSYICKTLGCSQETARYWIAIARMGMAHQWNHNSIGRPRSINDEYLDRLRELANNSPRNYGYAFQRWTAAWLSKHLNKELGIQIGERHINRLLAQMGLSKRQRLMSILTEDSTGITIRDLPILAEGAGVQGCGGDNSLLATVQT